MQALVLVGGRGSRLDPEGKLPPKPLRPLLGVSVLERIFAWLAAEGVERVVLSAHYRADDIAHAVGDGARYGLSVHHLVEPRPLGTAGAVRFALPLLESRFLVVYGDVLADVELPPLLAAHHREDADLSIVVHPNDHPFDSDRVATDAAGRVVKALTKKDAPNPADGVLCCAALLVMERRLAEAMPELDRPVDLASEMFPRWVAEGRHLRAWRTAEYLKDMGTADRAAAVERDLARGVPRMRRRTTLKGGVLVDRDGVLIEDADRLVDAAKIRVLPGAAEGLRRLNAAKVPVACVTNQPIVARGDVTFEELHRLEAHVEGALGQGGAWVDSWHTCPHHPDKGFAGERPELKGPCRCRKPAPGLLHDACAALGLDPARSIVVGDRSSDLLAAERVGAIPVGLSTGAACADGAHPVTPEAVFFDSLDEASAWFLEAPACFAPHAARLLAARVLVLSGPSRSGKTRAAAALTLFLRSEGRAVLRVSMDDFIVPRAQRTPGMDFEARARVPLAQRSVDALLTGTSVLVPGYDAFTSGARRARAMTLESGATLVLDGVLAGRIQAQGVLHLALDAAPDVLAARGAALTAWKGRAKNAGARSTDLAAEDAAARAAHAHAPLRGRWRSPTALELETT